MYEEAVIMIDKTMEKALNKQVNAEMYAAYLYLDLAAYFETTAFSGFASWMYAQVEEEIGHAMRIFHFINERGGQVVLETVEKPDADINSPLEAFEAAFEHEQKVTAMINNLVDMASELNDHATYNFLQWYVDEQVEEESSVDEIIEKLKLIGDQGNAIFMVDRELGARVPTLLAPPEEE